MTKELPLGSIFLHLPAVPMLWIKPLTHGHLRRHSSKLQQQVTLKTTLTLAVDALETCDKGFLFCDSLEKYRASVFGIESDWSQEG